MAIEFEPMINAVMSNYMDDLYVALPATVIGVQKLSDGLIDVQPLINKVYPDGSKTECADIYSVPVIMPCTLTSSITMPVNQGDTVLLIFSQQDLDTFKNGADTPHDPSSFRTFDLNDAVALIGLSPINKSRFSATNHKREFDNTSLIISHNVGTENESFSKYSNDGSITIDAVKSLNLNSPEINIKAETINVNSTILDIKSKVMIDGMNLNNFMEVHNHKYTDDGSPMTTDVPQGY